MSNLPFLNNMQPEYIERLYQEYVKAPESVDKSWRYFFEGYQLAGKYSAVTGRDDHTAPKERHVLNLIKAYRQRGHYFTKTNPVRTRRKYSPTLDIENFNLSEDDLDTMFHAGEAIGLGPASLRQIIDHLQTTYCKSFGAEYQFIRFPERVEWLRHKMESSRNQPEFSVVQKKHILHKLNQAVVFEKFLHTKYAGQKRFSLEGGETLIPALDAIIEYGAENDVQELMFGMPHRGRLNVMANILNKDYEEIFSEFEGEEFAESIFEGDVKYHLGYSGLVKTQKGRSIHLSLAPNPSHLESVNATVEGMVRSKIDHVYNGNRNKIIPVIIHGDAALAGQGVIYEVLQMSLLEGYSTGGTIHIAVNNQLGFTTNYLEGRSSTYCTDVAKVTNSPVFHVNADDVEAVVYAARLALEYRQKFHTDVFIDLLGYRRYGHNESDEPRITQPKLYKEIARHPDPRILYSKKLNESGEVEKDLARSMENEFKSMLQEHLAKAKAGKYNIKKSMTYADDCDSKKRMKDHRADTMPDTAVDKKNLLNIANKIFSIPDSLNIMPKLRKLYSERLERVKEGQKIDWAVAELMAYGALVKEGINVRLSGQDSERGTFSHRIAVLNDEETEEKYIPLNHIHENQAKFSIFNSPLSEYGVLGFEYGYACANPNGLTIWEAQFGDFANGGQIIIDQYLSSSEAKWNRTNGLVLYLPHGYEGQGPEHSSARIERFLSLCADDNMRVVNITSPASFFHLLRMQPKSAERNPLIVFTPKSLLRHPECLSDITEFISGGFKTVIDDHYADKNIVHSVLLCSGKIYYELSERQKNEKRNDIAIIRLEQLYPLPENEIKEILNGYKKAKNFAWVQEEPENMGALRYLNHKFTLKPLTFISREESSTPASGFYKQHSREQNKIIEQAFGFCDKNSKRGIKQ
ncbi:MAG: 2-oxoglutarate dehydrogenase E1 component [Calditrichaceae bacterium]|nr:2-oxoglutarate dehydrogenase E1 component [Calditrichaceae bacterium]RQV97577.1 MAG: 2-oxoglutarate dehydrogenase E1 component [Calditrichota bacterium]